MTRRPGARVSRSTAATDCLSENVRSVMAQMPDLTERVYAHCGDSGATVYSPLEQLCNTDIDDLEQALHSLKSVKWNPTTASAFLADNHARLAVLRLVAAAVRLPPSVDNSGDGLCQKRTTLASCTLEVCTELLLRSLNVEDPQRQPVLGFVHGLLRTQAVQAASCQLAALSQPMAAVAAATEAAEDGLPAAAAGQEQPHGQHAPEPGAAAPVAGATPSVPVLLLTAKLATFVYAVIASVSCLVMYKNQDLRGCLQLCGQLAEALQGGLVLEHTGRALLLTLLRGAVPAESSPTTAAAAATPAASCGLAGDCLRDTVITAGLAALGVFRLAQFCRESQGYAGDEDLSSTSVSERLQSALSGRCTRYAVLSLGLALLSAADGGPLHGLPETVRAALPLRIFRDGSGGEGGRWLPGRAAKTLQAFVQVLALGTPDSRARQPSRRCALALVFRVGWLAVASARELEDSAGGGKAGKTGRDTRAGGSAAAAESAPRLYLEEDGVFATALHALSSAAKLLPQQPAGRVPPGSAPVPGGPCSTWEQCWRRRRAARAQRRPSRLVRRRCRDAAAAVVNMARAQWWQLAAAMARWALPYARGNGADVLVEWLSKAPSVDIWAGVPRIPPKPPAAVVCALEGGLLSCVELLLRRAGPNPHGPEAVVIAGLFGGDFGDAFRYLAPMLAYGDPRQAAALLATLGKLVRHADPRVVAAEWKPGDVTQQCFVHMACGLLTYAAQQVTAVWPVQSRKGATSPAVKQLARLACYAICQLLPALSHFVQRAARAMVPTGDPGAEWHRSMFLSFLQATLRWIPLLEQRCCAGPPGVTSTAQSTGASASGTAAGPDGGWRELLLEDAGAVALLDVVLPILVQQAGQPGLHAEHCVEWLQQVISGCRAVAALHVGHPPASAAAPPAPALPWRPELLRKAAAQLRSSGASDRAAEAEALAAQLDGAGRGGGKGSAGAARGQRGSPSHHTPPAEALPVCTASAPPAAEPKAYVVPPPAEARCLLFTCEYPGCANLEGDSEAEFTLQECKGCGAVWYCSWRCQMAHWRAGHKAACEQWEA